MTRWHVLIPSLTVELMPTFRCGRGQRMFTARGAYMRAAWYAIHQAREAAGVGRNDDRSCTCRWVGDGVVDVEVMP